VTWGEIYRTRQAVPERGHKPGFYVVVSRDFVAGNDDIATVICAPLYSEFLGLRTEVALSVDDGVPQACSIRCDFLMLMFKSRLTRFVAMLPDSRQRELKRALRNALQLGA
jgi:mRNA-degrading endonuclease toxin of MazEF toxin-antitoxin module